jgi:hypothetical protein
VLLTLTTTHRPATDLGYLLHKHPGRVQTFELSFGTAHVFYPRADDERCTCALLLDVDPIGLVRKAGQSSAAPLQQYVNDRPYVGSSFLSVAIGEVFGSALGGRSKERADLAEQPLPFEARLAVLPARGGASVLRRLFEPLGYTVDAVQHPLDEQFAEWGLSRYFTVELCGEVRLRDLLSHLYVLVPVLFGYARPATIVLTTPNVEHNVRFPRLPAGGLRYKDHRFEWTRAEFASWCSSVGEQYGYAVTLRPVGAKDPEVGPPTQMAVFVR